MLRAEIPIYVVKSAENCGLQSSAVYNQESTVYMCVYTIDFFMHYRCKCHDDCQNPYGSKNYQGKSKPDTKSRARVNNSNKLARTSDKDFYNQQNVAITKSIWNLPETLLLLHLYPLNLPWERKPPIKKSHLEFEKFQELYGKRLTDGEKEEEGRRLDIKKKTISHFRSKIVHLKGNTGIYDRKQ